MRIQVLAVSMVAALGGCADTWHEFRYGRDKISPGFSLSTEDNKTLSGVYTWPSSAVGAMQFSNNRACFQSAQSAKARDSELEASGNGNVKAPDANIEAELAAALSRAVTERISELGEKDSIATFTDVAMFHICMMAAGDTLNKDTLEAVKSTMETARFLAEQQANIASSTAKATTTGSGG